MLMSQGKETDAVLSLSVEEYFLPWRRTNSKESLHYSVNSLGQDLRSRWTFLEAQRVNNLPAM